MAIVLTVGGTDYTFPEQGANQPWGNYVTDWADAVTDVLGTLVSSGDILLTSFTVVDNISSATNVTGLSFDNATIRSFTCDYSLYRADSTDKAEVGTLEGCYSGSGWNLVRISDQDVGVIFTIDSAGQVKYTSSSTGSNGVMKFRARTTPQ